MKNLPTSGLFRARWTRGFAFFLLALLAIPSSAQNFSTILSFNGTTEGTQPYYGPLVQGRDGDLYGTTYGAGAHNNAGTIFKLDPTTNVLTTIYNFCALQNCTDGASSVASVILGTDGNFYGTTAAGGDINGCSFPVGCGVVFKFTPAGALTVLHVFEPTNGAAIPVAGLVQGSDGKFYGAGGLAGGAMEVYRITSSGVYTSLSDQQASDGAVPYGGLIQATDGMFYGTAYRGGAGRNANCGTGCGIVFRITSAGKRTTLHSFNFTDGAFPVAGLVQAADGNFYGTTAIGGTNENACQLATATAECGTLFAMTPAGTLTTLYNFCALPSCDDGAGPYGTLIQATDGNFYGTTFLGGVNDAGMVFQFNPTTQTLSNLHSFGDGTDGIYPYAGLVQATNGKFYGTTDGGGSASHFGTIFTFDMGLGPFVKPMTYSGKVGASIEFLGPDFTKSSTVSFNGTSAMPAGITATYLTAKVPNGATTGAVTVTTFTGTLTSNKIFRVIPQVKTLNPASGPVGTAVTITGVSLTQTSKVTIGGKSAAFTVNSDAQVAATVPAGAKTGKIVVTTAGGTATSPGTFTVTP